MNMSDEVTGAALQVATRAAESGMHMFDRTLDLIAKLLQMLAEIEKNRQMNSGRSSGRDNSVTSTNLTDLKSGAVRIRDLISDAKKNNDTISASEQGLTDEDRKYITKKAKEYGIPVAFTGTEGKDNLYANVRTADLPIFQRICTDMMKDKIAERPQELGNFKVQEWEMPFIINELNKHDLSAQFGKTRNGEYFCLYEKSDEKAVHIARNEFVRKCNELKTDITFDRDEQGFYTLKDIRSGREISFDKVPSKEELAEQIQQKFGYDENKAKIACAKFGEEQLKGLEKEQFFSDNPQNEFSNIESNVHVEGESVLTKEFSCWHMTPKSDKIPRVVFRNNEDGKFAVLNPEKMTRKQMSDILRKRLGLKDDKQINALIDKADKISEYYTRVENSTLNYEFKKTDFDMSNPDIVSEMRRTDNDGNTFTKEVPVNSVENAIERTDKDNFTVEIAVTKTEKDQNGKEHSSSDKNLLRLSFSDKKDSLFQMTQLYKRQGMPEHIAKQMAKDVFRMAENQNPEKVVLIEEARENSVTLSHHDKRVTVDISKPEKAVKEISDTFDISEIKSENLLEMANEKFNTMVTERQNRLNQKLDELVTEHRDSFLNPEPKKEREPEKEVSIHEKFRQTMEVNFPSQEKKNPDTNDKPKQSDTDNQPENRQSEKARTYNDSYDDERNVPPEPQPYDSYYDGYDEPPSDYGNDNYYLPPEPDDYIPEEPDWLKEKYRSYDEPDMPDFPDEPELPRSRGRR